jgi:hypothetical protein
MRRTRWAEALILGVVMATATIAVADDESDRGDLEHRISDKLDAVAASLGKVASASSSSDVDDAQRTMGEVGDLVNQLDRVKGDDDTAKNIAGRYPDYIRSFKEAASALKELKENQRRLDDRPDKCKQAEQQIQDSIRDYVANAGEKATEGLEKLPETAARFGDEWGPQVVEWEKLSQEMLRRDQAAKLSVGDGRWSNVSSSLNDATTGVFDYWARAFDSANRECGRLAKGKEHPDVVKALADLGAFTGDVKQTYGALKADYDVWFGQVKQLREFTGKDLTELREVMCNAGDYEMEQKVKDVADRWSSQISSVYGTVTGQGDRLIQRADAIIKISSRSKSAQKLKTAVQDNLASIAKIKDSELQGSNNPKIRAKLEYGKNKHTELEGHCSYSEVEITSSYCQNNSRPGSDCRLDCIIAGSKCTVYEIKPHTTRASEEGDRQLSAYVPGLSNWYRQDRDGLLKKYPDLVACEHGDGDSRTLDLDGQLNFYDFCPSSDGELGEEIKEVNDDTDAEVP